MSKYRILPVGGGGIVPSGTLEIRSEGTFDVTDYAEVDVDIFDDTTTKSITANGTYNAEDDHVLGYSQVNVAVEAVLQNKTVTPTTSQQTVEKDSGQGYDGLGTVTINGVTSAIDANIIASNIRDGVTILGVTGTYTGGAMIDPQDFLHFYNPNNYSATIGIGPYAPDSGAVLYYSTDPTVPTDQWTRWQFNDGNGDEITLGAGETVYIYGDNPFGIPKIFGGYDARFTIVNDLECHGNIMSLLSIENKPIVPASAFSQLFANTNILTVPDLPATAVGQSAYTGMFQGCTKITSIPSGLLPATRLSAHCYSSMFQGCTGITSIPSGLLPATTLASCCYQFMFYGCTNLASVPSDILPATTLAEYCYDQMFAQTSITRSPDLPATTLYPYCYSSMFYGCASLTTIGTISATVAASGCMFSMFNGCTSLTSISLILPATNLADSCYSYMFSGCTSLVSVDPNMLTATTLAEYCYSAMFNECTSLTISPKLPATVLASGCYNYMFQGCTSLSEIELSFSDSASQTWYSSFDFPYSDSWVDGVSQTGLFKKLGNANIPIGTSGIPQGWTVQTVDYFYIQNEDTQDLTFTLNTPNYDYSSTDLAWSKDMSTWTQFTKGVSQNQTVPLLQGEKLYLRSSTGFAKYQYTFSPITISCDGLFSAHGDLRTLIDYTDVSSVTSLPAGAFYRMFYNTGNLTEIDCTLNGVTTIGAVSFGEFAARYSSGDTNLTRVRIWMPDVTSVNGSISGHAGTMASFYSAFDYRSALQEITAPNLQTWDGTAFVSWMYGVNSTGTAYVPTGVTIPSNSNGIPANWTRVNY